MGVKNGQLNIIKQLPIAAQDLLTMAYKLTHVLYVLTSYIIWFWHAKPNSGWKVLILSIKPSPYALALVYY